MCRLFGLIANRPVDVGYSLTSGSTAFRDFATQNPDGWGIGWYQDGLPQVRREPLDAAASERFERHAHEVSTVFVSHLRRATTGVPSEVNCHPFPLGRWLFAHNGSLDRECLIGLLDPAHRQVLRGQTDSEVYGAWLLQSIEAASTPTDGIATALETVRADSHSGLNFILTDGETLYAYREASASPGYYSLWLLERDPRHRGPASMRSHETGVLLESKSLNDERAVLVCSERLTDEAWREIAPGTLVTVGAGLEVQNVRLVR
jgi:glutamine amidotransferase